PGALHVDFAADFEDVGPALAGERRRYALQGADVGRHILAGDAVAAGRAEDEAALFVAQRGGEPIDLRLGHYRDALLGNQREVLRAAEEIPHAGEEIAHVLFGKGV